MQYKTTNDISKTVRDVLPGHAEDIYKSAFNAAVEQYGGDESRAHAVAWSVVKKKYKKNDSTGKWEEKN